MTFLTLSLAAIALASPPNTCPLPSGFLSEKRVFTNADLDLMAACRYQTGVQSEVGPTQQATPSRAGQRPFKNVASGVAGLEAAETDWRAQWRSVDQKARRLRLEASELRHEAREAPRDPRKRPTGRRSPSLLIARAEALEAEARDLENEFQERARREGALPGWLRPKGR